MSDPIATMQTLATPAPAQTHELTRAELLELTARQAREIVRLSDRNQALNADVARLSCELASAKAALSACAPETDDVDEAAAEKELREFEEREARGMLEVLHHG